MMKLLRVLVIDDESVICDACELVLSEKGHTVTLRNNGRAGLNAIREGTYDILLLDMKLPDIDGMDILKVVREEKPGLCTIVMTGYSSISNAVQAMRKGADNYLAKPFTEDELVQAIEESYDSRSHAHTKQK
ncbi:MAG TPA: response regulator [Desulfobacteraceae bacterium]|nr:response regulator [Desulfobacteraceae bacterium]